MPRRLFFSAIVIVFVVASIELLSALAYYGIYGERISYDRLHERVSKQLTPETAGITRPTGQMVIHPYLGFVFNPEAVDAEVRTALDGLEISRFGFVDTAPLLAPRSRQRYRVAVLGGSVAAAFGILGRQRLVERLEAVPQLAGRRVEIINLGMAGYKQPQTLLTLMWVQSLGAEFDAVINLDGFNDIALPESDNVRQGVMAAYPREWANLAPGVASLQRQLTLAKIARTREDRRQAARQVSQGLPRYSTSALLVWSVYDRALDARLAALQQELGEERQSARRRYQVSGGFEPYASRDSMYDDFVALWQRGSRLLDGACRASGARYYHFLQPNQYVAGSKPLSAEERRTAWRADHPYGEAAEQGYPRLVAAGRTLRAAGVRFTDLHRMFAHERRTVYEDDCCHLGTLGNQLLAEAIGDAIAEDLAAVETRG